LSEQALDELVAAEEEVSVAIFEAFKAAIGRGGVEFPPTSPT